MTTFLLIRHGRTSWIGHALAGHTPGVGIDDVGREQADRVARHLSTLPIAAVYSSPLQRTMETATPLARALGLEITSRPRLTEINFGQWNGATLTQLEHDPLWRQFNTLRSITRPPGGESTQEVQTRMVDELEELRRSHLDEMVAVFSHQDAIKAVLAHYLGTPLDLFHRFDISPGSVSVVRLADWGPQVVCVNTTGEF